MYNPNLFFYLFIHTCPFPYVQISRIRFRSQLFQIRSHIRPRTQSRIHQRKYWNRNFRPFSSLITTALQNYCTSHVIRIIPSDVRAARTAVPSFPGVAKMHSTLTTKNKHLFFHILMRLSIQCTSMYRVVLLIVSTKHWWRHGAFDVLKNGLTVQLNNCFQPIREGHRFERIYKLVRQGLQERGLFSNLVKQFWQSFVQRRGCRRPRHWS